MTITSIKVELNPPAIVVLVMPSPPVKASRCHAGRGIPAFPLAGTPATVGRDCVACVAAHPNGLCCASFPHLPDQQDLSSFFVPPGLRNLLHFGRNPLCTPHSLMNYGRQEDEQGVDKVWPFYSKRLSNTSSFHRQTHTSVTFFTPPQQKASLDRHTKEHKTARQSSLRRPTLRPTTTTPRPPQHSHIHTPCFTLRQRRHLSAASSWWWERATLRWCSSPARRRCPSGHSQATSPSFP